MNKDVIYIDVEDDVTAIIGKVKDAKEKVVALVPPKRSGVLQSAVNLRLLQRTAKTADKRLVLITNDQALVPLAGGAGIPVAKNLQSKPEIPEIAALKVDDDDDIIDGSQLPVGDHAATANRANVSTRHIPVKSPALTSDKKPYASPPKDGESPRKPKAAGKVPNFGKFRKKLVFIILGVILLIAFLVWAIFFAARATVEITAKTSAERVSTAVSLGTGVVTDVEKGTLKAIQVEEKQDASVDFIATGTEEKGEAAGGTITLSKSSPGSKKIPMGTGFSNGDCTFVTRADVTVPGASPAWNGSAFTTVPGTVDATVKATSIGEQCNLSARSYQSTESGIGAKGGNMSGGSKKTLKIVTQADVQKAAEQLAQQEDATIKEKLRAKFEKNVKVIDTSFRSTKAESTPTPQVGQEAPDGKAKLTSSVTYVMNAVSTSELESFIEAAAKQKLSKENDQRVYETGIKDAQLADFAANDTGGTANLQATTRVGPQIEDNDVKNRVKGKRFGDIQADLKSIQGVDDVQVKFWPFWVNTVPEDNNKITIKFNLLDASNDES